MFGNNSLTPYYQPSGRAPAAGTVLFLVGGVAVAWILGIVYTYVLGFVPSVYVSVLGTFGFGVGIGLVCRWAVKVGKLRSPSGVTTFAVLVTVVGLWLHWAFFCAFIFNRFDPKDCPLGEGYAIFLQSPAAIGAAMSILLEEGHFSVGSSSDNITGVVLAIVWIIEAAIIFAAVVILARAQAKVPFSEACDCWAHDEKLPGELPFVVDVPGMKNALEYGDISRLMVNAGEHAPAAANCAQITLHAVEEDPDCRFLSLVNVTVTVDKKGKEQRKNQSVVQYLRLSAEKYQTLRTAFGTQHQPDGQAAG